MPVKPATSVARPADHAAACDAVFLRALQIRQDGATSDRGIGGGTEEVAVAVHDCHAITEGALPGIIAVGALALLGPLSQAGTSPESRKNADAAQCCRDLEVLRRDI